MKVETTISIEADLLEQVKNAAKDFRSHSEVFERALREYLPKLKQKPAKRKLTREEEIEILNRIGTEQREEILETLNYQADLWNEANFTESKNRRSATRKVFACLLLSVVRLSSKELILRWFALRFIQIATVCLRKSRSALTKA